MTVGIISYLSQRGLGTMAHDLRQHLNIDRQLVIPDGEWPMNLAWTNGEEFYLQQWEVQRDDLIAWRDTDNIDTVVSIETGFGDQTFKWCKELGMRTILVVMWESFNPNLTAYQNVDLYICPSFKAYQEVPFDNRIFIPYPIDTTEFTFKERTGPAKVFVHNAGSGGLGGRKGTRETVEAFMRANPTELGIHLILRSQVSLDWLEGLLNGQTPDWLTVDYRNIPERAELYVDGDVLIYPSHYDGHALVTLEAMAAGMPVIVTDAEPMNEYWATNPLAVKVAERKFAGTVNPHCLSNLVDIDDLAAKIRWCASTDMGPLSRQGREIAEKSHSWAVLHDRWQYRMAKK